MSEKAVSFTRHARQKIDDLAALGFVVSEPEVIDAVLHPDRVDWQSWPPIAQKGITARHVLRVVFVEDETGIRVITLYPGRRSRYEPEDAL